MDEQFCSTRNYLQIIKIVVVDANQTDHNHRCELVRQIVSFIHLRPQGIDFTETERRREPEAANNQQTVGYNQDQDLDRDILAKKTKHFLPIFLTCLASAQVPKPSEYPPPP